ncbi:hypothetical protein D3C74_445670 [compost metagenome]
MFLIVLKHRIEAIIVYDFLTCQSDNQCPVLCPLQMIRLNEVIQESLILIWSNQRKGGQRKDGFCKISRLRLPHTFQHAHRLMVEHPYGHFAGFKRLDPLRFYI